MIPISPQWFVFLYLLLFLSGIFILWIAFESYWQRVRRKDRRKTLRCDFCGAEFPRETIRRRFGWSESAASRSPEKTEPVPCPACRSLQEWTPSVRKT